MPDEHQQAAHLAAMWRAVRQREPVRFPVTGLSYEEHLWAQRLPPPPPGPWAPS